MDKVIESYDDNEKFTQSVKVPHERIAVIIGKEGSTKSELESLLKCNIDVDSKEGDVTLISKNSIDLMVAKDVIKAIARGFNPELAKKLVSDEYFFESINLNDYNPAKNHQMRLKGRVIGRDGRCRNLIEEYTGCFISIYGKTICVIGKGDAVRVAMKAIDSLLTGSPHAYIYKWLEKEKHVLFMKGPSF